MYINNNVHPLITDLGVAFVCRGCGAINKLCKNNSRLNSEEDELKWYKQVTKEVECLTCGKNIKRPEIFIVCGYHSDDGDFYDVSGNKICFDA